MATRNVGNMSKQEFADYQKRQNTVFIKSNFCFLNHHKGLRPSNVHVIMGTSGSGKSTLARSIIADYANLNPEPIFVCLSEENSTGAMGALLSLDTTERNMGNVYIESELEHEDNFDMVLARVLATGSKVLMIDNLTTSRFYDGIKPDAQKDLLMKLKKFTADNNIVTILIMHTQKHIHDNYHKLITEADIGGSSAVVKLAEFFYIMQKFQIGNEFYPTLTIAKHRDQAVTERLYVLGWNSKFRSYEMDTQINWETFSAEYSKRNKL